jgi:membrane-bound serine protease (ClpP class)
MNKWAEYKKIMRWFVCLLPVLLVASIVVGQEENTPPLVEESQDTLVYVLPFKGEVEIGLVHVLTKGFAQAEQENADYIFLEMDTPGGRVDAALDIVDLMLDSDTPVILYVKGDATSAGAIISLAAEAIFMEEMATIGTAAPVLMGGGESDTMESKALSFVLAKVRTICERRGFDEQKTNLALAMVDKEIEVKDPDDPDKFLKRKGIPLTLTANEAARVGFITEVVKERQNIFDKLGLVEVREVYRQELASEKLARFFSSTGVTSLLLTLGFLGLFLEFRTPGFGLPGILGVLAIALFFWGHAIAHLAGMEGPILFLTGVFLLILELFVIPGFGFTGIAGFFCILASIVLTLMEQPLVSPNHPDLVTIDWSDFTQAMFVTVFTMTAGIGIGMAMPFLFPALLKSKVGSWLMLDEVEDRAKGYHSAADGLDLYLGKQGVARSVLRPSGIAEIDGVRVDVVSQGGFIQPSTRVEVIKVEGRRIVVKPM